MKLKYKGYVIKISKVDNEMYEWDITGKSGFTGFQTTFADGISIGTMDQALRVAKSYVNENLMRM